MTKLASVKTEKKIFPVFSLMHLVMLIVGLLFGYFDDTIGRFFVKHLATLFAFLHFFNNFEINLFSLM